MTLQNILSLNTNSEGEEEFTFRRSVFATEHNNLRMIKKQKIRQFSIL